MGVAPVTDSPVGTVGVAFWMAPEDNTGDSTPEVLTALTWKVTH